MPHDPRDGPPTLPRGAEGEKTPSGLEIFDIEIGRGERVVDDRKVRVHFRAWLANGKLVDDTRLRDGPIEFRVGDGEILAALDEGVLGMQEGGRRRLIAPADLGYGARGSGKVVPPYATLILDVELVALR